jgi:excinuclease ABC subunit C
MHPAIADKLATLPAAPGVYLMKDERGEVFYVGKAKSLRDRVRSYFSGADTRAFVALLEHLLADLEVVLTNSEKEALLVEDDLVKRYQPRFNVELTDDKRFLCLRLDARTPYPRLELVRRFGKDGARYFGPYTSAASVREAIRLINRHFQLRTCSDNVFAARKRPCLQYQIKRCPAPCVFALPDGEYAQNVENVIRFLSGDQRELLSALEVRMRERARELNFEAAAQLRDQIHAIERSLERQRVVTSDFARRDVVGLYREGPAVEIHVMRIREGRLVDAERYSFEGLEVPTSELLADFAVRYYASEADLPSEILFPPEMEWSAALTELLAERTKRPVEVKAPQRGDKRRLVELAARNAAQAFRDKQREKGAAKSAVERLRRALHLTKAPHGLECFDISHLGGTAIVASAVRFEDGVPRKDLYRHYRIRSTTSQDDFQSLYEVVSRRARRGLEEGSLPDLIVIDGGKGQLNAARAALEDNGIDGVDLISLAKAQVGEPPATAMPPAVAEVAQTSPAAAGAAPTPTAAAAVSLTSPAGPDSTPTPATSEATLTSSRAPEAIATLPAAPETAAGDGSPGPAVQRGAKLRRRGPATPQLFGKPDRVFVLGQKNPIVLGENSAELFLLARARDEAHRFAISFQRRQRKQAMTRTILDEIPGVGATRRRALLRAFGSVTQLKAASEADIARVVGRKAAAAVVARLHDGGESPPSDGSGRPSAG